MHDGFFTRNEIEVADAAWRQISGKGTGKGEAAIPIEAKQDAAAVLEAGDEQCAVLFGFFYRGRAFEEKGIFTAGYLGSPSLEGYHPRIYSNSYCFGPLTAGHEVTLAYDIDGVKPFSKQLAVTPGINICHIPVEPTKPLIYVIPHSHYDPEWTEKYEPYNSIEMAHVLDRLRLLHDEPGHCFSLCEEAVLKPLLERRPDIVHDLRRRIEEGVCEPKGTVVSTDFCMPLGESMIRQTLIGEFAASEAVGIPIRPETLWNVDVYGLSFQLPQILLKSGRKYFVIGEYRQGMRKQYKTDIPYSNPKVWDQPEFWLEGLDGSKVLAHRSWYIGSFLERRMEGYGIRSDMSFFDFQGMDFSGPKEDLVEAVKAINADASSPFKAAIATSDQFFHHIEQAPELPTLQTESWMDIWTGSYESRVRGRQENRKCEGRILAAETIAAWAARSVGLPDLRESLREAWFTLLINHHHDPQMTPMFEGLFPEVLERYDDVLWQIRRLQNKAVGVLANHIRTVDQPGRPIVILNTLGWWRDAVVEYPEQGIKGVLSEGIAPRIDDADGNPLPVQLGASGEHEQPYKVLIQADRLPASGWQTVYLHRNTAAPPVQESPIAVDEDRIENEHVSILLKEGHISSITLKDTGTRLFGSTLDSGINEVFIWKDDGCICEVLPRDFFDHATVSSRSTAVKPEVRILEEGPVRGMIETSFVLEGSEFTQRIILNAGSRRIDFRTRVDWLPNPEGRRIRIAFSSMEKDLKVFRDIPFAALQWEQTDMIRPFTSWFAMGLQDDSHGAALIPKGLHSGHLTRGAMWLTLFRSVQLEEDCPWRWSLKGDEALEPGINDYEYSLYPYEGTWESAGVPRAALEVNTPVFHHWSPRQEGMLPGGLSCLSVVPEEIVVSAWMQSYTTEDTIVRAYNPTGQTIDATLTVDASSAAEVNFREEFISDLEMENGTIPLVLEPYEIKAIRLRD